MPVEVECSQRDPENFKSLEKPFSANELLKKIDAYIKEANLYYLSILSFCAFYTNEFFGKKNSITFSANQP